EPREFTMGWAPGAFAMPIATTARFCQTKLMENLARFLDPAFRPRVLVVGDLILDEYLRGDVCRISPEAPVPVLESAATSYALGGAANVARNLAALGAHVELVGVRGCDAAG